MRSLSRAAAVALAAAALGAGCGSDSDRSGTPSTTGSTAPTVGSTTSTTVNVKKSAFAEKADAVCDKWQSKIDEIPPPADPAELAPTMKKTIPLTEKEVAELRKVEPPPKRSATVANFIDALERTVAALKQYVTAAAADDGDAAQQALLDADEQTDNARRLAAELGLTVCGAKR
jgi:hypothetical protein